MLKVISRILSIFFITEGILESDGFNFEGGQGRTGNWLQYPTLKS